MSLITEYNQNVSALAANSIGAVVDPNLDALSRTTQRFVQDLQRSMGGAAHRLSLQGDSIIRNANGLAELGGLQGQVDALETRVLGLEAIALDHEARILVLEQGSGADARIDELLIQLNNALDDSDQMVSMMLADPSTPFGSAFFQTWTTRFGCFVALKNYSNIRMNWIRGIGDTSSTPGNYYQIQTFGTTFFHRTDQDGEIGTNLNVFHDTGFVGAGTIITWEVVAVGTPGTIVDMSCHLVATPDIIFSV